MSKVAHIFPVHDCFRHRCYPDDVFCECNPGIKWDEFDNIMIIHDHIAKPAPTLWAELIDFREKEF